MDLMLHWKNLESANKDSNREAIAFFRTHIRNQQVQSFLHEMVVLSVTGRSEHELRARREVLTLALDFFHEFSLLRRCLVANLQPDTPQQALLHVLNAQNNASAMRDDEIGECVSAIATNSDVSVALREAAISALRHGAIVGRPFVHTALASLEAECHSGLGEAYRTLNEYAQAEFV